MGRPSDGEYLAATNAINLADQVHPDLATVARTSAEVIDAMHYARRTGLPIRTASTRHGATASPSGPSTFDRVNAKVAAVRRRYDPDGLFAGDVDPIRDQHVTS